MMPSDPSFGTGGFFSYLWTPRKAVFDNLHRSPRLMSDDGLWLLTDDDPDGHFDNIRLTGGAFDSDKFILTADVTDAGDVVRWI